jgi:cation transport ATPase
MPIQVTCPNPKCLTRFNVADKFAGQKGPCPKCKTVITIPKKEEEVVIHAPEHSEAGAIGAGGRHALKTYKRTDTKFQPLVFTGVVGFVLVALLVALVLRSTGDREMWMLAAGAIILGPALAWAGYPFLRDAELEGYQGSSLVIRSVACGLVYALLWGIYVFVGNQLWGADAMKSGLEIYQLVIMAAAVLGIGTFAAYVSLDLEPGSAFFHCAMYFAVTVLLRLVAGLAALPGLGGT